MTTTEPQPVELYFDFVSPYSYLALTQARAFARNHSVTWRPRPVVYAALLGTTGLLGPVEVDIKRRYTFGDIQRAAALLGVPLVGPPAHPFRSLEALRTVCCFLEREEAMDLSARMAHACWGQGQDLTDPAVLGRLVTQTGLDADDLPSRIASPAVKKCLRDLTAGALDAGVFGVPTFVLAGELFWGHDRLSHLAARLADRIPDGRARVREMLSRPRGADRPGTGARDD